MMKARKLIIMKGIRAWLEITLLLMMAAIITNSMEMLMG